jgi:hypothetical protein
MIPLPTPDTRTVASTRWGTPDYVPCTPSPQAPWRPTTADVTAGSLAYWEPSMDGVVTHVGKGDGVAKGFREAKP